MCLDFQQIAFVDSHEFYSVRQLRDRTSENQLQLRGKVLLFSGRTVLLAAEWHEYRWRGHMRGSFKEWRRKSILDTSHPVTKWDEDVDNRCCCTASVELFF